ncbi:MAG: hypothetical protein B7Y41_01530 [Hydrogenophilales bacterium 28-61-23]|nr:MAG: hypothetical protein B7Y41_01530 [Hydrogenophilales bacterium 28-61-23]
MHVIDVPEQKPSAPEDPADELSSSQEGSRFHSWRGFLFASVAVNLLFVYGMLAGMGDATVSIWYKSLVWLPFNVISTALYLAIMARLGNSGWALFRVICVVMIVANWSVMFVI